MEKLNVQNRENIILSKLLVGLGERTEIVAVPELDARVEDDVGGALRQ